MMWGRLQEFYCKRNYMNTNKEMNITGHDIVQFYNSQE
jgi:hypothetical protein